MLLRLPEEVKSRKEYSIYDFFHRISEIQPDSLVLDISSRYHVIIEYLL